MGDQIEIFYPKRKNPIIIDYQDYEKFRRYNWNYSENSKQGLYPVYDNLTKTERELGIRPIYLHHLIANLENKENIRYNDSIVVEHKDGNPLNNTRDNLRICTQQQNCFNKSKQSTPCTSKYKGVYHRQDKDGGKRKNLWRACIRKNDRLLNIGSFKTEELAAKAYDEKALELFGEFAKLNFPKKG